LHYKNPLAKALLRFAKSTTLHSQHFVVASGLKAQQMRWQNFSHQIQKRAADICSPLLYLMRSYRKSGTLLLGLAFHHTDIANVV